MRYLFNLYITLVVLCVNSTAQPAVGTSIPGFRFTRLTGETFESKHLAPGKLLLFVFVDTDCDHCQHAVQEISKNHQHFSKAVVYVVSMNSPARINQFMSSYGKNLVGKRNVILLQDTYYDFISKFKPRKSPGMFLYSNKKKLLLYSDDEKNIGQFVKKIQAQK